MDELIRDINLRTCTGLVRKEVVDGVEYTVVPVTALVEGVIQAVNAPKPEFVRADRFSVAPSGWDGRPVFINHPMVGGRPVSGNSPQILKTAIGRIHNTRVSGKKLLMEAWLDPRIAAAKKVIERCESNKPVEISTGALIVLENTKGTHAGKEYDGAWDVIIPDHLAILEEGLTGACSQLMGCGIRAAHAYEIKGEDYIELRQLGGPGSGWTAENGHVPGSQGGDKNSAATGKHHSASSAHEKAAAAHEEAAKAVEYNEDSDDTTHAVREAVKESLKASKETKSTGAKPYADQAARTYAKKAQNESLAKDRAQAHREAAKYHRSASKEHKIAASWGVNYRTNDSGLVQWLRDAVAKLGGKKVEDLTPVERELLTYDGTTPGEEDAELIQYQTLEALLDNCGSSYKDAKSLIQDLIIAESNPSAYEGAEETIESAQLNSLRVHCMSMISSLSSMIDLCRTLTIEDRPQLMAYMAEERTAAGKRHSSSDEELIQSVHDKSVTLGANCGAMKASQGKTACGCSGHAKPAGKEGEDDMNREQRITALMSSEHNPLKDKKALEASSEEGLKALEAHVEKEAAAATARAAEQKTKDDAEAANRAAAAAKPKTKEEWLAEAPAEVRTLVAEAEADRVAEHTALVAELKAAQKVYSEEDLKAKTNKELRQLRDLVAPETAETRAAVDFRTRTPRNNEGDKKDYMSEPPPNGYRIALDKASGGKGKEQVN